MVVSVGVDVACVVDWFEGLLAGFCVVRGFAGPVVGFHGGCVEVFLGVSGRVVHLGKIIRLDSTVCAGRLKAP